MNLLKRLEDEAEMLLAELKARCEQLRNAFGANAHAHIDPLVDALQAHVDAQAPVAETEPVEESAPAVEAPGTNEPAPTQAS
jgi:predicted kinase